MMLGQEIDKGKIRENPGSSWDLNTSPFEYGSIYVASENQSEFS